MVRNSLSLCLMMTPLILMSDYFNECHGMMGGSMMEMTVQRQNDQNGSMRMMSMASKKTKGGMSPAPQQNYGSGGGNNNNYGGGSSNNYGGGGGGQKTMKIMMVKVQPVMSMQNCMVPYMMNVCTNEMMPMTTAGMPYD